MNLYVPVAWSPMMLKLQWFVVASSSGYWPYAYRRSIVEKKYFAFKRRFRDWLCDVVHQAVYILHLIFVLWIALFLTLESIASFIVLSRLTEITIGEIKFLSLHLSNLITLPFFCNFLSSSSTCDCRLIGILRPLWWMGVKFVSNFDLIVWFFDRPILFIRLGIFLVIFIIKFYPSRFCIYNLCHSITLYPTITLYVTV